MNEPKPRFLEGDAVPAGYYEKPNPYVNAPSCHVNLLEISRYAKRNRKKLVELMREEVKQFSI